MDSSSYDFTALRGFCVIFSTALIVWPIISFRYLLPSIQRRMEKSLEIEITKGPLGVWKVTEPQEPPSLLRLIVILNQISVILIPGILILVCSVYLLADAIAKLTQTL